MAADLIDRRLLSFVLYDWLQAERLTAYPRFAEHSRVTPYMQAFGHVIVAWLWLDLSLAASRALRSSDETFMQGIRAACRYFFAYELPRVSAWLAPAVSADRTVQDLQEAWL